MENSVAPEGYISRLLHEFLVTILEGWVRWKTTEGKQDQKPHAFRYPCFSKEHT